MKKHRSLTYRKYWSLLLKVYGPSCYYCDEEYPTVIDHVIPVAAGGGNGFDNLVPSCAFCNLIASDKVFTSLDEKRRFLIKERGRKSKRRRYYCSECLMPYEYRYHSPSLLLCAECYDFEYDTTWSKRNRWARWLAILDEAGYFVEAYRVVGDSYKRCPMVIKDRHRLLRETIEAMLDGEGLVFG